MRGTIAKASGLGLWGRAWGTLPVPFSVICQRGFLLPPAPHQLGRDSQQGEPGEPGLNPDPAGLMAVLAQSTYMGTSFRSYRAVGR